uniref:Prothoracicotropic hormone preproprotein n=1 Tax=Culex pipiens TaxID=7175 RepID=E3UGT6_CULPI|nr:prothoracicotropic hormone preproprotein [Culex pipiens]ADO51755.1 prothoracicotropic hormone preproprotein [Culex pipiens]
MRLTIIAICATVLVTCQTQGKLKYGATPLFENIFLSSNYGNQKLSSGPSINCFPPADRNHKYEWAGGFNQGHILEELHPEPRGEDNGVDTSEESDENQMDKRSEKGRDMSSDLYAQYPSSCACQTKYELLDLGYTHFPRYIVNAICQNRNINSRKCWRGSRCKEIPYKVRVLTRRSEEDSNEQDHHATLLPETLRDFWRFRTVTIAAACQCSI